MSSRTRSSRRRGTRLSSCAKTACTTGGAMSMLGDDSVAIFGNSTVKCPTTAICPNYFAPGLALAVLYGFFVSLLWATKPSFILKAGVPREDPNSPEPVSATLYSLLFTAIVLLAIGLLIRCTRCTA